MNVSKVKIIKAMKEVGLTPNEASWYKEVETFSDFRDGVYTETNYYLNSKENVSIDIFKEQGAEPDFSVNVCDKNYYKSAIKLRDVLKDIGYIDCLLNIKSKERDGLKQKLLTNVYELGLFDEDYQKIIDFIIKIKNTY